MIAIVLGTRPEIIKMSPTIWEYKRLSHFILNTNPYCFHQGKSPFFEQLDSCELKSDSSVNSSVQPDQI